MVALKRGVKSGQAKDGEISIADQEWRLVRPPHRTVARPEGSIVGLTCAAVDVTERKEGEAHLRLLMRELTHRSKNLLAVIQGMARQTARHVGPSKPFWISSLPPPGAGDLP